MFGLLRPIIPFGTPAIFWTKTLYHLKSAIDDQKPQGGTNSPRDSLLDTINAAMLNLAGPAGSHTGAIAPFALKDLELGETRVFKTNFELAPSTLAIANSQPPLSLGLIVQISISLDFAQWTFIVDLGKDEDANRRHTRFGPLDSHQTPIPNWRTEFLKQVHKLSSQYERALEGGSLTLSEFAERESDTDSLMRVCYVQIWEQFQKTYEKVDRVLKHGRRIHEAKGLALSTRGLFVDVDGSLSSLTDDQAKTAARGTTSAFPRFLGRGGENVREPNEANATLSAFWPMVKIMTPDISERQYVACGVLGFKALLISALGSPKLAGISSAADDDLANRVLFIAKAEPQPTQLARIVDRLVSLEVFAAYSLWHDETLLKADRDIMLLGNHLDEHIREWTNRQSTILDYAEDRYKQASASAKDAFLSRWHYPKFMKQFKDRQWIDEEPGFWRFFKRRAYRRFVDIELYRIDDVRDAEMASAAEKMNNKLTRLARDINNIGSNNTAPSNDPLNVQFMVGRSRLYSEHFNSILPTFQGGNIDTWLSYDSFGRRGRMPRQSAIDRTGVRIETLNRRLQAITELIQTSALIWQTTATRSNTAKIRRVIWQAVLIGGAAYVTLRLLEWLRFLEWARNFLVRLLA